MIYDHVILGAGLSGLLKAESLLEVISANERVLIVDPHPEDVSHRTFCSWRKKSDSNHPHRELVSHRYSDFRITSRDQDRGPIKSFGEFYYERISGEAFHRFMHQKIFSDPRFEILIDAAKKVIDEGSQVVTETESGKKIISKKLWNSLGEGTPDMIQHFFGFEIETEIDFFDENVVDLMDFRTEQKGEVRFFYILPFSKTIGLVEFTIFSNSVLTAQDYEKELRYYLWHSFNLINFKVRQIEQGAIPMSLDPWPRYSSTLGRNRILPIGAAAAKIKASTGYSFIRNQADQRFVESPSLLAWRFQVYDTLLIGIMRSSGAALSEIFPLLFSKNSSKTLFSFLDEKTSFSQEVRIFASLPWKNFLFQLIFNYPFFFVAGFVVLISSLPAGLQSESVRALGLWGLPVLGLFCLGLAHGGIDHRLLPQTSKVKFFTLYLAGLFSFFVLWLRCPVCAFALFVLISGDHFGESQFLRALKISRNQRVIRFLAMAWGLAVSLMAPLFHWETAQPILQSLLRNSNVGQILTVSEAYFLGLMFCVLSIASATVIARYERKAMRRSLPEPLPTVVLCFILWKLPLIPGFFIFFCFWHSWETILQQRKGLQWSVKKYVLAATPLTLVAALFLILTLTYFESFKDFWAFLFLLLGALTVSHSVVMKRFYKF